MKKDINYLVLTDIHLGHPRNHTDNIIFNLERFFITYHKELVKLDILFIAGDIFDRLLSSRSIEYRHIMTWLSNTLLWCRDNGIKLRILYGTPSHDNDQVASFTDVASKLAPDADYKYINTLYIEHMVDLDINILYVPDEFRHKASDTYLEVGKLLKESKLAEVDIAIMHGCFSYQMPILKDMDFVHKESDYLDIVKHYIAIGHIHTSSVYERIIAPGSFDRLAHGEEENKGAILFHLGKDGNDSFKFLENSKALPFLTYSYSNETETEILKDLKKKVARLPNGSNIRVELRNDTELLKNLKSIVDIYPNLVFKFKTNTEVIKKIDILETVENKAFAITKDNIVKLMEDELELNKEEKEIFNKELEDAISSL